MKKENFKENVLAISVILVTLLLIGGFVWLIIDVFFLNKPSNGKRNLSSSDVSSYSSVEPDNTSSKYYTLDDIFDVEGNYIPEADNSPVISANEDGNYITSPDVERYIVDKTENKIMWIKKVHYNPDDYDNSSLRLSISYNYSAKNVEIKVTNPEGVSFLSSESHDDIFYIGTSNIIWEFDDAQKGEYTVEIIGEDVFEYDVRIK